MTDALVKEVLAPLVTQGTATYAGEVLSVTDHSLQTAQLARLDGAAEPLIAACLLHDVGWLLGQPGRDHETQGADFLARFLPASVVEPVRLHVMAKRYLSATEPDYLGALSAASVESLRFQGGPLGATEAQRFARSRGAQDAINLRRFDDQAKDPDAPTPALETFEPLLAGLLGR